MIHGELHGLASIDRRKMKNVESRVSIKHPKINLHVLKDWRAVALTSEFSAAILVKFKSIFYPDQTSN